MKLSFHTVTHGGSIKILSKDQNPTTLQSVCEREKRRGVCVRQRDSSYPQQGDRTEGIKQWCGKFPSSPVGLCCGVIASMCLKKEEKKRERERNL